MGSVITDILKGNNTPIGDCYEFKSSDHIRYQNGIDVSGHNYGCHRTIRFEKNQTGDYGYSVTILNDDGIHPFWGNNVQMSPKQMKISHQSESLIILRGFGYDMLGNTFSDYGMTIEYCDNQILSCTLHIHDRNVDIRYIV